jgi:hypothetical protein
MREHFSSKNRIRWVISISPKIPIFEYKDNFFGPSFLVPNFDIKLRLYLVKSLNLCLNGIILIKKEFTRFKFNLKILDTNS